MVQRHQSRRAAAGPFNNFLRTAFGCGVPSAVEEEDDQQECSSASRPTNINQPSSADTELQQLRARVLALEAERRATSPTYHMNGSSTPGNNVSNMPSNNNVPDQQPPGSLQSTTYLPFGFNKTEIEVLRTDADPNDLSAWITLVASRLQTKSIDASHLLASTHVQAQALFNDPNKGSYWRSIDANLSTLLFALVRSESKYAKRFYTKATKKPGVLASGHALAMELMQTTQVKTTAEHKERKERLENEQYFKIGMNEFDADQAAQSLRRDWQGTASGQMGDEKDLIAKLLSKFPPELQTQQDKLECQLSECEILGTELPWDFDQLADILAVLLRRRQKNVAPPPRTEVSAAERREQLKNDKGPCTNCGGTHHWLHCTLAPCSTCGRRWCQGARHMQCYSLLDEPPVYKDYQGRPLYVKLQEQMNELRKTKGKKVATTLTNEASVLEDDLMTVRNARTDDAFGISNPQ